jgi:hypothetical protein
MSLELPNSRNAFLPQLPENLGDAAVLKEYLGKISVEMERLHTQNFDNIDAVRNVISPGISGTFVSSAGATITVVNGVITGLS